MTESAIQREIYLAVGSRPDVRLWRANAGKAYVRTSSGFRPIQMNLPGCPDLVGFISPDGRFLGIEVKAAKGKLRPAQKAFRDQLTLFGGLYIVARSVEDVERELPKAVK